MSRQQKAYKYALGPTQEQEALFRQFAGARRWAWNWALSRRIEHYKATGKGLSLAVLSDGERICAPKHYRRAERKLRRLQRHLSRCKPGGKNREKARLSLAKLHRRVANQRHNHLHKLTTRLVRSADAICIEDLHIKGLAKSKLAKSVYDSSWGRLRLLLSYKCLWQRKHLVVIDRFYPSSRLCRACGSINETLTLADRVWTCPCGASHDRDDNAAETIRLVGLSHLLAEWTPGEDKNAFRAPISLPTWEHGTTTKEAHAF
jgi:putative transposase